MDGAAAQLSCPAALSEEATAEIRDLAAKAFDAVNAEGLSRVDFFYTEDGKWIINEINTMPGFTPSSMYPHMWAQTGIDYADLIDELISPGAEPQDWSALRSLTCNWGCCLQGNTPQFA